MGGTFVNRMELSKKAQVCGNETDNVDQLVLRQMESKLVEHGTLFRIATALESIAEDMTWFRREKSNEEYATKRKKDADERATLIASVKDDTPLDELISSYIATKLAKANIVNWGQLKAASEKDLPKMGAIARRRIRDLKKEIAAG